MEIFIVIFAMIAEAVFILYFVKRPKIIQHIDPPPPPEPPEWHVLDALEWIIPADYDVYDKRHYRITLILFLRKNGTRLASIGIGDAQWNYDHGHSLTKEQAKLFFPNFDSQDYVPVGYAAPVKAPAKKQEVAV